MDSLTQTAAATSATVPQPPMAVPTPTPMATGSLVPASSGKMSVTEMLKELNWVEVGFGILGAAALYYTIYYYRYKFDYEKNLGITLQTDIEDLNDRMDEIEKEHSKMSTQPAQSFEGFGQGVRAIPTGFNSIF